MKGLIQRVSRAGVTVDCEQIASIDTGLLLLLGVEKGDGEREARELCRKILTYRIFPDGAGRMNLSLLDVAGSLLIVPQFTLAADTSSGTRPGFSLAAAPDIANQLFQSFLADAQSRLGPHKVGAGRFGADMKVDLVNDGPVTFMLESGRKTS